MKKEIQPCICLYSAPDNAQTIGKRTQPNSNSQTKTQTNPKRRFFSYIFFVFILFEKIYFS